MLQLALPIRSISAGTSDHSHDQRVEEHGAGEAEAEHLDHDLSAEDERGEYQHHDRGRGRDRPSRCCEARVTASRLSPVRCHSS